MKFNNIVLEGKYKGKKVKRFIGDIYINVEKLGLFRYKRLYLNYYTVEKYELINRIKYVTDYISGSSYNITDNWSRMGGHITRDEKYEDTVLITFKDGDKSLIRVDGNKYSQIKEDCKYGLNFDKYIEKDKGKFSTDKEIICPHCGQIFLGGGVNCPNCMKSLKEQPQNKLYRKIKKILICVFIFLLLIYNLFVIIYWNNQLVCELLIIIEAGIFVMLLILLLGKFNIRRRRYLKNNMKNV